MIESLSNNSIYRSFETKDDNGNPIQVLSLSGNYSKTFISFNIDIINPNLANQNKEILEEEISKFRAELNNLLNASNLLSIN